MDTSYGYGNHSRFHMRIHCSNHRGAVRRGLLLRGRIPTLRPGLGGAPLGLTGEKRSRKNSQYSCSLNQAHLKSKSGMPVRESERIDGDLGKRLIPASVRVVTRRLRLR